ncbi:MAG: CHAT domain-containing protein [Saprospiraceae bacterium]|nr:CHAT domain-containing protein [Saprospiraceae bacterium]
MAEEITPDTVSCKLFIVFGICLLGTTFQHCSFAPETPVNLEDYIYQTQVNRAIAAADHLKYQRDYVKAADAFISLLNENHKWNANERRYVLNQAAYSCLQTYQDSLAGRFLQQQDTFFVQDADRADYRFNQALLKYHRFEPDTGAMVLFKQALEGYRRVYPENHWKIASTLNWLGLCYYELLGDTQAPRKYISKAYELTQSLPIVYQNETEFGMAVQLRIRWGYDESMEHARKAVAASRLAPYPDTVVMARALANEARILRITGNLARADTLLSEAYGLLTACNNNRVQEILKDRLNVYAIDPSKTQNEFNTCLKLFDETTAQWGSLYYHRDALLGDYFYENGDFQKSKAHFLAFHRIRADNPVGAYRERSLTLRTLTELYGSEGKMDSAFYYWREDLLTHYPYQKQHWPLDSLLKPDIFLHTKNPFKSFSLWGKMQMDNYFSNSHKNAKALYLAIRLFEAADQTMFKSASDNSEDGLLSLSEETAGDIYPNALRCVHALWKSGGNKAVCFDLAIKFSERQKSYILQRNKRIDNPEAAGSTYSELIETIRDLNNKINVARAKNPLASELVYLHNQADSLHELLQRQYPEYTHFISPAMPKLASVISMLQPGELLVDYSLSGKYLHTLVIGKQQMDIFETDLSKTDLLNQCRKWYEMISTEPTNESSQSTVEFSNTGYSLYRILLGHIRLEQVTQLTIIPDGPLHLIPFETLLCQPLDAALKPQDAFKKAPYLLCQFPCAVRYTPALRLLNTLDAGETQEVASAALFTYGPSESPFALIYESEIRQAFSKSFPSTGRIFEGENCRAKSFLSEMNRFDVLHLLLHAESNENDRHAQTVYFGLDRSGKSDPLYSYEIAAARCRASLLILSACETGKGRQTADGVYSVARAFMQAGVQRLVYSLWEVDLESHALFMQYFYRSRQQGSNVAQALHQAKLDFMNDPQGKRHPYFWAVMVGAG